MRSKTQLVNGLEFICQERFEVLTVIVLLVVVIFLHWHLVHKRKNYPNGPVPLSFFGNALTLSKYHGDLDKILIKWQEEFGNIHTIWASLFGRTLEIL